MRWLAQPTRSADISVVSRLVDALEAACHPRGGPRASVPAMVGLHLAADGSAVARAGVPAGAAGRPAAVVGEVDVDELVRTLYVEQAGALVRMARLFVDDRNAAEDLVQEAFIRLARHGHRIADPAKSAAYLRSIVLNLARDHNRRGLVSLRHRPPADAEQATAEDEVVLRADRREVIDALRSLPARQRDCVVLRYYFELGVAGIADTLGISQNSVKTHLTRGLAALGHRLEVGR